MTATPGDAEVAETPPPGLARYRRRRRIRAAAGAGSVLTISGAVVVAALGLGGAQTPRPPSPKLPPATAKVTRATLTQTEQVDGVLGYGAKTTVIARAGIAADNADGTEGKTGDAEPAPITGTLTWLPRVGAIVEPGQPLFRVNNRPVVLLSGSLPPYRVLTKGAKGADVELFERNLRAFGYSGFTVDSTFSSATTKAVKAWQKDLGVPRTGKVNIDQVVVARGRVRVAEHKAAAGAEATGPVLTYTGTTRVVTVPLEVERQHLVRKGMAAKVVLPNGKTVTGRVARISTVAATPPADDGGGAGDGQRGPGQETPTVDVVLTIAKQRALGRLDAAPVALTLVTSRRKNVLTVPVGALVALLEGGYGVQAVEGSATRYVAVETGMFAAGRVEISGAGITEGMTVGVPA